MRAKRLGMAAALAGLAAGVGLAAPAGAAVIVTDDSINETVPAVSLWTTNGAQMSGMLVTLNFSGGGSETVAWETTGAESGGAFGSGWSITESGTTFSNDWFADFGELMVQSMVFDGQPGLTLFDLTFGGLSGTDNSELGLDFASSLAGDDLVIATYERQIALEGDGPIGDLWNMLTVDFGALNAGEGITGQFTFVQDTDNDARRMTVPEPSGLGLFGLTLLGLGVVARRRRG